MKNKKTNLDIASLTYQDLGEMIRELKRYGGNDYGRIWSQIDPELQAALAEHPDFNLRQNQIVPDGDWRTCLFLCGRGFGKSFSGAGWIYKRVYQGFGQNGHYIALVAPSMKELKQYMIPPLLASFPEHLRKEIVVTSTDQIHFPNGAVAHMLSADVELRGGNYDTVWIDEMCKWNSSNPESIDATYKTFRHGIRIKGAKIVITTTPKSIKTIIDIERRALANDPKYTLLRGTTFDNPTLDATYIQEILDEVEGTPDYDQEVLGIIKPHADGALWSHEMVTRALHQAPRDEHGDIMRDAEGKALPAPAIPKFLKVVIGLDIAVSVGADSDETGIIVAALGEDNRIYILEDASGKYNVAEWTNKVAEVYHRHKANMVVVEINNGGNLVAGALANNPKCRGIPVKTVHAKVNKSVRAEKPVLKYHQNKVTHLYKFDKLVQQMTSWNPKHKSPDRIDALVYAILEFIPENTARAYRSAKRSHNY